MTLNEQEASLRRFAKEFRALQKIQAAQGSFKLMKKATICAGLAEVCEMLADSIRWRE